ncbi:PQQ-binding-like beta-propeller repeat protein [Natrinema sp. CBA1119]|uniref:outer membrane protein assembly factor BamB family protein n=1 Tax=Natrinema sp. CBA1119 TaxID=1608465 RepID=UPI00159BC288|nr:PQQ-binding-like beta-propeller repeat protein [Natrinema sp. CBA1119]
MYGVDPQNTGHHPTATGPSGEEVELRTVFESEGVISNSPAIVDGTLYVAADNHLHAVDLATEELEWKKQVTDLRGAYPTVSDEKVYAGTENGIVAINRNSEDISWRKDVGISSINPVLAGNSVVGTENMILYRFHPETGAETILHDLRNHNGGRPYTDIPAYNNGIVYFAGGHFLYAVNAESGKVEWTFKNPEGKSLGDSNPTVANGTVYIGGKNQRLYAIDADNGTEEWSEKISASVECSPSIADGTIYFGGAGAGGQQFFAIDIKNQEYIWEPQDLRYSIRSKPVIVDGMVYVTSYQDIFAFDSEDGTIKWDFKNLGEEVGDSLGSSLAVFDGSLYVSTTDGKIHTISGKSSPHILT